MILARRAYAILVPVLTLALTTAATLLSTRTEIRPDVGSISFGFPLSWLSISHGFINAPPLWTVDPLGLAGDIATWFVVSAAAVYLWMKLRVGRTTQEPDLAGAEPTSHGRPMA